MDKMRIEPLSDISELLADRRADPCIMVIFGAAGDLTKRLLMPAIYNLACDDLLPERFVLVGVALDAFDTDSFRAHMSNAIEQFSTRDELAPDVWSRLAGSLHYVQGRFEDLDTYRRLASLLTELGAEHRTEGNILFYLATPPSVFGVISRNLVETGASELGDGWKRLIIEKPFGDDLESALRLNRELLDCWSEEQIYRIDHYLGKETVQNILAFRFSNGMFEPLWNKHHIDHIQLTVAEQVGVEGRGRYYERAGVLRDMIQNHMLQMLSYVCMEPPASLQADVIRDEKATLLKAVRCVPHDEHGSLTVRGQYGAGQTPEGATVAGYRAEPDVDGASMTETFAAMKLSIDNQRWEGVPVYVRSGKRMWKRETTIAIEFKRASSAVFQDIAAGHLASNRLVFHIQPTQGIELRFQAKRPGPAMNLQGVNMRFDYGEAFEASRGTGYETLLYNCLIGDAALFSRTDLVEAAWRIAQPILDSCTSDSRDEFPNYDAGTWGPRAAFELIERDGRRWIEIIGKDIIEKVPLFSECSPAFLNSLSLALQPIAAQAEQDIIRVGDVGNEMYFINRGAVQILDARGDVLNTLEEGGFFGEIALIMSQKRTATVRAITDCDLLMLHRQDLLRVLKDYPRIADDIMKIARERYKVVSEVGG